MHLKQDIRDNCIRRVLKKNCLLELIIINIWVCIVYITPGISSSILVELSGNDGSSKFIKLTVYCCGMRFGLAHVMFMLQRKASVV